MNIYKQTKIKKVIVVLLLTTFFISPFSYFKTAHAIPGKDVPIDTMFNYHNIEQQLKDFVLNGLAWHVAKIMVQQITASTVQWINSGFQGSPAFLTNPAGFFANVGDQITGDLISSQGPLSKLCSPFNIDVRLNLALNQAGYGNAYTCTLSTVINNIGKSTINGASINGFMNGDFKQGGWPAFISLSQPNNNASAVYLQAQGDLQNRIGSKQNQYQQQLTQGHGFLSWQSCTNVSANQVAATANMTGNGAALASFQQKTNQAAGSADVTNIMLGGNVGGMGTTVSAPTQTLNLSNNSSITANTGSDGTTQYQDCQTKTPGSVIESQLENQLGSGVAQLNLAQSIDQIVDAFLAQLVTQVLQKGLAGGSQRSSGVTQSYIQQLSAEANSSSTYSQDQQNIQGTFAPYIATASQTLSTYSQILSMFDNTKAALQADKACFQNLISNTNMNDKTAYYNSANSDQYNNMIDQIDTTVSQLASTESPYNNTYNLRGIDLASYKDQANKASNVSDPNGLQSSSQSVQDFTTNQVPMIQASSQTAQDDMTVAQTQVQQYQTQEQQFHSQCKASGGN